MEACDLANWHELTRARASSLVDQDVGVAHITHTLPLPSCFPFKAAFKFVNTDSWEHSLASSLISGFLDVGIFFLCY